MVSEGNFQSGSTEGFYERRWPVESPRANVVIVHGYREHCARYDHVAATLNARGFSVFSYDQRGHGRSPGKRWYIERFDHYLTDLDAYLAHLKPDLGPLPLLVLAHSMGGLVTARYLETRPFRPLGVAFSSPLFALKEVSPALLAVAGVLSAVTPWLPVANLEGAAISRVQEEVMQYEQDPLNGRGPITARSGAELSNTVAAARAEAGNITVPMFVMHGTADRLAPCDGGRYLHDHAGSKDKALRIFEGGYHELMNDIVRDEAKAAVADWLESRL